MLRELGKNLLQKGEYATNFSPHAENMSLHQNVLGFLTAGGFPSGTQGNGTFLLQSACKGAWCFSLFTVWIYDFIEFIYLQISYRLLSLITGRKKGKTE